MNTFFCVSYYFSLRSCSNLKLPSLTPHSTRWQGLPVVGAETVIMCQVNSSVRLIERESRELSSIQVKAAHSNFPCLSIIVCPHVKRLIHDVHDGRPLSYFIAVAPST